MVELDTLAPDAPASPFRDRSGQVIGGRLVLRSLLGRGGMGEVYRAVQTSMGRDVAVKLLRADGEGSALAAKRFLQEARLLASLNHPNVVSVYDFGEDTDGTLFLVMELLKGQSLGDLLARGRLSARRAVRVAAQACDALTAAHALGLVHRDLKPDNLFIVAGAAGHQDLVKILDFGIARPQAPTPGNTLTQSGSICGTPAYMSPEQALGRELDGRSDLYSFGLIIYEMLTGSMAVQAPSALEAMYFHVNGPLPDVSLARPELRGHPLARAVEALLQKAPLDRPKDAATAKSLLTTGFESLPADTDDALAIAETGEMQAIAGLATLDAVPVTGRQPDPTDAETTGDLRRAMAESPGAATSIGETRSNKTPWVVAASLGAALAVGSIFAFRDPPASEGPPAPVNSPKAEFPSEPAARTLASGSPTALPGATISSSWHVARRDLAAEEYLARTRRDPEEHTMIVADPAPKPVRLSADVVLEGPADVVYRIDGVILGEGRLSIPRPPAGRDVLVQAKRPGFQSRTIRIRSASPASMKVVLTPEVPTEPALRIRE